MFGAKHYLFFTSIDEYNELNKTPRIVENVFKKFVVLWGEKF